MTDLVATYQEVRKRGCGGRPDKCTMHHMDIWNVAGSLAAVGTFLVAVIGIPFAIDSLARARRGRKTELLSEYFTEYRSPEMGRAVTYLWKLYKECGKNQVRMADAYIKLAGRDRSMRLHIDVRRRVSHYYQQMGFLAEQDPEIQDLMFRIWTLGDLRILRDIIIPLELNAAPYVMGDSRKTIEEVRLSRCGKIMIQKHWSASLKVQAGLFNTAQRWQPKIRKTS
jgi:hypothetical protein